MMKIVGWEDFSSGKEAFGKRIGAALGVFDGLHKGHCALLDTILRAPDAELRCALTFIRNPKAVLRPEYHTGELFTLEQKLEALDAYGMEVCILIDFSENFSKLSGVDFLSLLLGGADFSLLAVGRDFRCGYKLDTDSSLIRGFASERNVRTEIVEPFEYRGHVVSSSRIRRDISEGRMELAWEMLGRPYELDLRMLPSISREGRREFNRAAFDQVLPPRGAYRVEAVGEGGEAELEIGEARVILRCPQGKYPERIRFKSYPSKKE
jgi:riboflavin kinase/FMN adenylyltransferase